MSWIFRRKVPRGGSGFISWFAGLSGFIGFSAPDAPREREDKGFSFNEKVERLALPSFSLNTRGEIVEWNHEMAALTRTRKEEVLGQTFLNFVESSCRPSVSALLIPPKRFWASMPTAWSTSGTVLRRNFLVSAASRVLCHHARNVRGARPLQFMRYVGDAPSELKRIEELYSLLRLWGGPKSRLCYVAMLQKPVPKYPSTTPPLNLAGRSSRMGLPGLSAASLKRGHLFRHAEHSEVLFYFVGGSAYIKWLA